MVANRTVFFGPIRAGRSIIHGSLRRLAASCGQRAIVRCAIFGIGMAAFTGMTVTATAQSLPTGGSVAAGSASIATPNATTLNVNQSTSQAIINWQSFSVGSGGTVNFNQPGASSATLNRVTGDTPSRIAGAINAPGTVVLVNPNGIAITKSGVVNTGGFAASTLDIKNEDFLAGKYKFSGNGASATVTNAGRINVSDGGFAALLGGRVANDGIISARLGKVGLGSGEMITLDMSGDGFLSVAVPSNQLGNLKDGTGKALVTNSGKIRADGGAVYLSAATASNLLRDAVNVPGSIRASSVGTRNGRIVIGGGSGGRVNVSGRLAANGGRKHNGGTIAVSGASVATSGQIAAKGKNGGNITISSDADLQVAGHMSTAASSGQGGRIDLTGAHVAVAGAEIDASGATGGGLVRIGGTFQGGNGDPDSALYKSYVGRFGALPDIASARTVTVDAASKIDVSAKDTGDAGSAVVWSQQTTTFAGTVFGLGGASGGNGGFVEVSGKDHLELSGAFDLRAPQGGTGTLLADPGSIVIQHGGNSYSDADTLNDGYVNGLLSTANVILDTKYATGANGASGDITLNTGAAISWNTSSVLTLNAAHNIVFQSGSSMTSSGGGNVVLNADSGGTGTGTVTFQGSGAQVSVSGGGNVSAYYNPAAFGTADFPTGSVSGPLTAYMLINNNGQFQAINNNLSGNYALSRDLNFGTWPICGPSCTSSTFLSPIGDFNGHLDGRGHSVNFSIDSKSFDNQGMFQSIGTNGVVSNLNATVRAYAGRTIGGIAGVNNGKIENSSAVMRVEWWVDPNNALTTGNVGTTVVGGLVGQNNGTILNSYGSLTTTGVGRIVGGLAGRNAGTITGSSSSGGWLQPDASLSNFNQSIDYNVGGLVGLQDSAGTITTSFSSAHVFDQGLGNHTTYDGGLVGFNNGGTISGSYSTGLVDGGMIVGGFVGNNLGTITTSFTTAVASAYPGSGYSGDVGGFAGWNGIVKNDNNILPLPAASITQSWAASNLAGGVSPLLRGFSALDGGTNANNYFDTTVSDQTVASVDSFGHDCACGATGLTSTASFLSASYSAGFMGTSWYMVDGYTRPIPTALRSSSIGSNNFNNSMLAALQLELVGSDPNGSYQLTRNIDLSVIQQSSVWSSRGWGPIGNITDQFNGTFDGKGFTINNLVINQVDRNITGLFGDIGASGMVKNFGLTGGGITAVQAVGAISGINNGTISGVYSTLDVTAYNNVGGLVGVNNGTISQSYSTGNIVGHTSAGQSQTTGGIVGLNLGTISDVYSTGNVSGGTDSNDTAGGIAGTNHGTITNVYATGTIIGAVGKVGALVGDNTEIAESYPPPDFNVVYTTVNHVLTNGYWNSDTMSSPTGTGVGTLNGGGGLGFSQMTDLANFRTNFVGFDFNNVWAPPSQTGQGGSVANTTPGLYAPSNIVWVDVTSATRSYGDANPTLTASLHGVRSGDPLWTMSGLALSTAASTTSNVGTYAIDDGTPQMVGANNVAYRFVNTGTVTVTPRALTGSTIISGIDKIYDGTAAAAGGASTLGAGNNVVNGDVVTLSASSGTYDNANVAGVVNVTLNSVALSNGNYSLGALNYSGTGSITPKTLTASLTGVVQKTYDGTDVATLTSGNYSALSGVVASDINDVALNAPTSGSYSDANASVSLKSVLVAGLALTGNKAGNYTIASTLSGTVGRIDPRLLTGAAAITGIDKIYDRTDAASGGSATLDATNNVVNGDSVVVSATSGTYGSINAGVSPQSVAIATFAVDNPNYSLGTLSVSGSGTISPLAITVTAATDSKVYDGGTTSSAAPVVTSLNQVLAGDTANFSQAFTSRNVLGSNASTLRASGAVDDGNGGNNYTIQFVDASGTITPATLTIAAVTDARSYDGTIASSGVPQVASGLIGSDTVSGFTQAFTSRNAMGTGGSTLAVNVGSGTVDDGNDGNNYTLAYQTAAGMITPAALTITAVTDTKIFDGTAASGLTPTVSFGQIFTGDTANFSQAFGSKNVLGANGSTLIASGAVDDGNSGHNYDVQFVSVAGSITPAPLTVTAMTDSRVYDGTTASSVAVAVSGTIFSGDTANFSQAYGSKNVLGANGSTLIASGAVDDGNAGRNYDVQFLNGTGTITPLSITVSAATDSKVYDGGTTSLGTPVVTSVNQVASGDTANFSQAFASRNVLGANGSRLIASGVVDDSNGGANYTVQFVDAAGTITPRPITVTADAQSKVYGEVDPALTYTVGGSGLGNGDTLTTAFTGALSRAAGENVVSGGYAIMQNTLTANSNYDITGFTGANLAITPRPITVVADARSKIYGEADPALAYAVGGSGLGNGDTLATAFTGALSRAAGENVVSGGYAIAQNTLAANSNYDLTNFTAANLTITPRPITVTADAQSKVYGEADPALTYTVGGSGLGNGDTLATVFAGTLRRAAGENVVHGGYAIAQNTLAANSNYDLTNFTAANLTITPRPITVTASAQSKVYGDADPALTYTVGGSGLGNGDTLATAFTGALSRAAGENVVIGGYAITRNTLAANDNYAITQFSPSVLSITPAPVIVTANGGSSQYGDTPINPGLSASGLRNGEGVSVLTGLSNSFGLGPVSGVSGSPYALSVIGMLSNPNYSISARKDGTWIVTPAPLTVTADAQTKLVGQADPALTYRITAGRLLNGDVISGALDRRSGDAPGDYPIIQGALAVGSNYVLSYIGADLTIRSPLGNAASLYAPQVNDGPIVDRCFEDGRCDLLPGPNQHRW